MKFVIVYMTESDLYTEDKLTSQEEVDAWLDENEYKAVVIKVSPDGTVEKEWHT